jgi:hypothetical protein
MHIEFFSDMLAEWEGCSKEAEAKPKDNRFNGDIMSLLTPMHQKAYGRVLDRIAKGKLCELRSFVTAVTFTCKFEK